MLWLHGVWKVSSREGLFLLIIYEEDAKSILEAHILSPAGITVKKYQTKDIISLTELASIAEVVVDRLIEKFPGSKKHYYSYDNYERNISQCLLYSLIQ